VLYQSFDFTPKRTNILFLIFFATEFIPLLVFLFLNIQPSHTQSFHILFFLIFMIFTQLFKVTELHCSHQIEHKKGPCQHHTNKEKIEFITPIKRPSNGVHLF